MRRLLTILFATLALGTAFAQTKFPLTIVCNVMGADVYINNKLYTKTTPNLVIQLPPDTFNIKVAKAGFREFVANVTVQRRGTTLSVTLQPIAMAPAPNTMGGPALLPTFPLNIVSNVPGAQVYLNNNLAGNAPYGANVVGGTYEIRVTAPGYQDFTQRLQVRSPTTINAMLPSLGAMLSVQSNVNGATVFINGNQAGQTPFTSQVPQGSYSIVVRAPGFMDYNQNVVVNGPQTVNAMLQPMTATWQFVLPETIRNRDFRGGQSREGSIQIFIDGVMQNAGPGQATLSGQLTPGRHTIRLVSGALASEAQVDIQAGKAYTFTPFLGINVQ